MDLSVNDPQLCFNALSKKALKVESVSHHSHQVTELSGDAIALEFAQQAAKQLSSKDFTQLVHFLECSRIPTADFDRLETEVRKAQEDFYSQEMKLSGQHEETFAQPAGYLDADLGLVLHLETKDNNYGNMFHKDSATIQLLEVKGVQSDLIFGMDWHWRGETKKDFSERRTCQFPKLEKDVRALHDNFSWQLLEMIRAPFIITGSACARDGIRRRLPSAVRLTVNCLEFDLDFRPEGVRRVYLHLPHPTAGFFTNENTRTTMACKLDAGWNFALWLTGEPHSQDTFRKEYGHFAPDRLIRCIPFVEVNRYRGIEKEENRILQLDEYSPSFRRFAENYLKSENVHLVSIAGGSLVERVWQKMVARLSVGALNREENKRRFRKECETQKEGKLGLKSLQGIQVHLSEGGHVSIKRNKPHRVLRFKVTPAQARTILETETGTLRLYFTLDTLQLTMRGTVVYERHLETMLSSGHPEDWVTQIKYETSLLGKPLLLEVKKTKRSLSTPFVDNAFQGQHRPLNPRKKKCGFNGLEFYFPDAVGDLVFFQADLVTESLEHPYKVSAITPAGDPGCRLALKVKYTTESGPVEQWAQLGGVHNMKKINTLVDYLEGRDRDWIAEQPRRYLNNHKGQKHWYSN